MPPWCSRFPSARSSAGLMRVSTSRSRFITLVWSAAEPVPDPLSTRSRASSSSDAASSQWTCFLRVRTGTGRDVSVPPAGLRLAGIQVSGPPQDQAGHAGHQRATPGGHGQHELGDRSRLVDDQVRHAVPDGTIDQRLDAGLVIADGPGEQPLPSLSSTSAKRDSLPTSRPTHTLTCSGTTTRTPSPHQMIISASRKPAVVRSPPSPYEPSDMCRMAPSEVHAAATPAATPQCHDYRKGQ